MLNIEWQNQVALVSGAGRDQGIGMAIARRLGAAGARLIVTASSARIAAALCRFVWNRPASFC